MVGDIRSVSAADNLKLALNDGSLVQSFSGVRTHFGLDSEISEPHMMLSIAYGYSYALMLFADIDEAVLVIGRDPRPTGASIASALTTGFKCASIISGKDLHIVNLGIITTPLIETAVRTLKTSGGAMITASHNPIDDNGFKFLTGVQAIDRPDQAPPGALLSANAMKKVVEKVHTLAFEDPSELVESLNQIIDQNSSLNISNEDHRHRIKVERAYLDFLGSEWKVQPHCLKPLTLGPVLVDPNGGAACGIAARVLEHFGVRAIEVNAELGYPEHAIDTDGIDPASGRHMLLRVSRAALRNGARFGMAFDYDADRGNIVLPGMDESAIIPPQTVAALNIALALAHREVSKKHHNDRLAIVVSESTSGTSSKIATMFGAEVFTVETGEINVVTKMHQLHDQGYDVPIGVEGANGGSIFGEATCRDGLMTSLCAALADEHPAMVERWINVLSRNNGGEIKMANLGLAEILKHIPVNANEMLKVAGPNKHHGDIKSEMERHFVSVLWPDLCRYYNSYRFENYEGTQAVEKRTGDESGGWRVVLESEQGTSFIFARGSRTEAGIWRLIIDEPDPSRFQMLREAAISMINAAMDGNAEIKK